MTKYDSNEQYELDRANLLYHLDLHKNEGWDLDSLDVVDVFNLLKQSKWIGNVDDDDNSHLKIRCLNPECGAEWHLFSKE